MSKETNQSSVQTLGKDADGIEKVMTSKGYVGDAVGQFSINTINTFSGQMTYFYTTKVGMSAASSGNIILISKIVDFVSDIIMGRIVDKTHSKEGKARFWLKMMILPTFLCMILLFTVPHIGAGGQFVYGIFTNILASAVVYTAIAVPYYTMINFETKSLEERGRIGTYRGLVGYITGMIINLTLLPLTNLLGGKQGAWVIVAGIFGIVAMIALSVCYKSTKERYSSTGVSTEADVEGISMGKAVSYLIHNKYWWMMAIAQTCLSALYTFLAGALTFYCQFVLGSDNYVALISTIGLIPSVLGIIVTPELIKKFGMRKTGMIAAVIGLIGTAIRIPAESNFIVFLIGYCLVMISTGPIVSVLPAMVINCAEWNDYKFGVRITGMTNSVASAGQKIGTGLAGASIGWILAAGGFNSLAKVQPASAIHSIMTINIILPGIMLAIILICYGLYSLEKKYPEIMKANMKKRSEGRNNV